MPVPPLPVDEAERLQAVRSLGMVGTPAEERFDSIVRLARAALRVPYAAVSVLDSENVWMKASEGGPEAMAQSREDSYCSWTVFHDTLTIIYDAQKDERVFDNPWSSTFRFYAGVPVHHEGKPVGTLCVGGPEPRHLREEEIQVLNDLGTMVEDQFKSKYLSDTQRTLARELIEAREFASVDGLTKVWSRGAIIEVAHRELARGSAGFLLIDIDHFKMVNDTYGHQAGDEVLRRVAERSRSAIRANDALGRYGGEEFLAVLPGCGQGSLEYVAERIRAAVAATPIVVGSDFIQTHVSIGGAIGRTPDHFTDLILKGADEALYQAKKAGRNRVHTRAITSSLFMRAVKLPPSR